MNSDRLNQALVELARVRRALGMALAELCRINSGCPSDANAEIWEAFEWMGGDSDALSRQIDFMQQMRKTSATAGSPAEWDAACERMAAEAREAEGGAR